MFPGMNPREVQKAMKRMGIKQEEIDAELVIIKTADKDLVIKNPHVTKVNMMGQALNALEQSNGNLAEAILKLQNK